MFQINLVPRAFFAFLIFGLSEFFVVGVLQIICSVADRKLKLDMISGN